MELERFSKLWKETPCVIKEGRLLFLESRKDIWKTGRMGEKGMLQSDLEYEIQGGP